MSDTDWRDGITVDAIDESNATTAAGDPESWRQAAAAAAKLPASFAPRLTGSTKEAIEADAQAIAAELGITRRQRPLADLDVDDLVRRFENR